MPLADLSQFHDSLPIIPDSGLQFLDFGITVGKVQLMPDRWGFRVDKTWPVDSDHVPVLVEREVGGEVSTNGGANCEVELKDIERLFGEQWVPVPLLRRDLSGAFFRGPTNWARGFLHRLEIPDENGHTHRFVLALDTRLAAFIEAEAYVAPSPEDAKNGRPFALPSWRDSIDWYLQEEWVRDWCLESAKDLVEKLEQAAAKGRAVPPPSVAAVRQWMIDENKPMLHLAAYRALLDWLHSTGVVPSIVIVDRATEGRAAPIDVDLVLDLGNSRTCGLLIEADAGDIGTDLTNAVKLRMRDLSLPFNVYGDPFASRIEFSRARFGRDHLSMRSGLADRFSWPSIVRVGPEAARLASMRRGSEGSSGLSSPKRYLWDEDQRPDSWRFNSPLVQGEQSDIATGVAFTTLVNDLGEALHHVETGPDVPIERTFPSIRALYARRNLMSFALAEILLQALCLINSPSHRIRRAANERLPRRLRRLIMTMPTAMPLAERQIFEQEAKAACELAYLALGMASLEPGPEGHLEVHYASDVRRAADRPAAGPEVRLQWDEASASQAIYLYTQIARNYSGDARAFFTAARHPVNRADPAMMDALRIATLDIGGGTTDLVITRLTVEGRGANVTVTPKQEFREGFNLAGDDAVLRIVRDHVIAPLRATLKDGPLGAERTDILLSNLFGGDGNERTVLSKLRRQQFANQIAIPIAIELLAACESSDPLQPPPIVRRSVRDLLKGSDGPTDVLVAYISNEVAKAGGGDFNLMALELPVDISALDHSLRTVFTEPLQALAEMVWRFRCDLLLLSGRPSRLPTIINILRETGCLPPMRIVPLHKFRVGDWYPFRDSTQATIGDPKTTAAVGAMVCLLSEGHLANFNYRANELNPASTARYFGKLDRNNRLLTEDEFYSDMRLDDPDWDLPDTGVEFRGPMALGFRQVAADWWPATRLYSLTYADDEAAATLSGVTPLKVELRRDRSGGRGRRVIDKFVIQRIRDRDDRGKSAQMLRLRLQTIDIDKSRPGYWLDTGILLDQ